MTATVLLDLDGTLIDSRPGIVGSLRAALRDLGHAPDPAGDLTWAIGPPMEEAVARILAPYGDTRVEQAVTLYRRHYGVAGWRETSLYPGIAECLAGFTAAGFALFLATSKRTVFARRILQAHGVAGRFGGIYGSEDGGAFDDKADLIAHILRREAIAAAVMVGDRRHDIEGAHANGLRAIGVTWGYGTSEELRQAGADALVDGPGALVQTVVSISVSP